MILSKLIEILSDIQNKLVNDPDVALVINGKAAEVCGALAVLVDDRPMVGIFDYHSGSILTEKARDLSEFPYARNAEDDQ